MTEERTAEIAELEADLRRTAGELSGYDRTELLPIVVRNVRRFWEERYAIARSEREATLAAGSFDAEAAELSDQFLRTRAELAGAEVDLRRIAAEGAAAYWSRRRGHAGDPDPGFNPEAYPAAAMLSEAMSALPASFDPQQFQTSAGELPVSHAFGRMSLSFLAVLALGISTLWLSKGGSTQSLFRITGGVSELFTPEMLSAAYGAMVLGMGASAIAVFRKPRLRRWGGATAGALGALALIVFWTFAYVRAAQRVDAAEQQLSQDLLMSLDQKGSTIVWHVPKPTGSEPYTVRTLANNERFRGKLLADVSPDQASLRWRVGDDDIKRGALIIGKVESVDGAKAVVTGEHNVWRVTIPDKFTVEPGERLIAEVDSMGKAERVYRMMPSNVDRVPTTMRRERD